jgi:hypothetical protein
MTITEALPDLAAEIARLTLHRLMSTLPPPVADTAADRAEREAEAIGALASLYPATAIEARLAARVVATDAHAMDCHRLAIEAGADDKKARACRAQAAMMMRQSQGALTALRRDQAVREKAEAAANPRAMERAGYWFREISAPPEIEALARSLEDAEPTPDIADEADQYARIYPKRAALIRSLGGLPEPCTFGRPDPELVQAIATGTSPTLLELDREMAEDTGSKTAIPALRSNAPTRMSLVPPPAT